MTPQDSPIFGIPIDFILFGLTLPAVAVFHQHTMRVALAGLVTVVLYRIVLLSRHFENSRVAATSNASGAWSVLGDRK
jgi:hypothetical protein